MTENDFIYALRRNNQRLFLIALSFTKSTYDAEDVVQNVFYKLWKNTRVFENEEHMDKWLTLVCINESKNYVKSFFRNHLNIDDTEIVSPKSFDTSQQSDLFNAVMGLPKKERTVMHLFYYEDLSVKDIAELLKIKESAVKTRLSRARNKLKERLGDDWINE